MRHRPMTPGASAGVRESIDPLAGLPHSSPPGSILVSFTRTGCRSPGGLCVSDNHE